MKLKVGEEYRRRAVHDAFGGQRQGGISTPSSGDAILLFSGETGTQYGYRDGFQPDGTYIYTGEGQIGDMMFVRGNKAVRDSPTDGKRLLLFDQVRKGIVRYVGDATCAGYREVTGPDRVGTPRRVIQFELLLSTPESTSGATAANLVERSPRRKRTASLAELRKRAIEQVGKAASLKEQKRSVRQRSESVREYVLRRSEGWCEACRQPAPFFRTNGAPYLEPHHTQRLADGGPDHPRWVGAVCPTCHRCIHSGKDGKQLNQTLVDYLGIIEPD